MDITNILEYQKKDGEKVKIERALALSEHKKIREQMIEVVKEAKSKTAGLESYAGQLLSSYESTKEKLDSTETQINKLTGTNIENLSSDDVNANFEKIATLSKNLNVLEKRLTDLAQDINKALNEFEKNKSRYSSARAKFTEHKEAFKKEEASKKPELDAINNELAKLEKVIDAKLMAKYKALRADRIYPVLVPEDDKSCGGCYMEIPYAEQDKLKANGFIECENCRRIIYK